MLRGLAEGSAAWAILWPCIHEFLAKVTHSRIFEPPSTLEEALGFVGELLKSPSLTLPAEGPGYWERLTRAMRTGRIGGAKMHDARIAALCAVHGSPSCGPPIATSPASPT